MKLLEKQIEDVFEIFHERLIEPGLSLLGRQYIFKNGRRADLFFEDKNKRKMVVELKRNAVTREDVGQLIEYYGILDNENPRIVMAAPIIPASLKLSFEHFGIEYLEFSTTKIKSLLKLIGNQSKEQIHTASFEIPDQIVSTPLSSRNPIDGNIAFKVSYNDNNWSGVCSPDTALYNCEHRTWCGIQKSFKNNCQSKYYSGQLDEKHFPCHDSIALQELQFYPGHNHGPKSDNEPRRCLGAKMGKIAVFTSRAQGEPENERFIFAIAQINNLETKDGDDPFEVIACDKNTAVIFDETYRPKYWNYYRNKNNPDRIAWNMGLFRYLDDSTIRVMLNDIVKNRRLKKKQKANCEQLLSIFK
ncbi:endonuclease NucS domain-containing protein [Ancylomarina sp. 16SWW S1-10-2]|uniref:endonuclease NucS domain-containing protein n=1 Tax=Ancylomarina sp. 16SWW S1-10-2 TaxID=2499681 RepID=UPI0012AD5AF2|nr:endonuclease NucS domain-containing protein [Ancylomarina sp. 16SWW S1-10-2]MRT92392.1 DUF91 domain-containing protein [Ancylomarina sp. 16SWW S1-10-2]